MKIKDITVEIMMGRYCLCWSDYNNNRFHVWMNLADQKPEATLYRNPPNGTKYRDVANGWYETRRLDLNAKVNKPVFEYALAFAKARELFAIADAAMQSQIAQEDENRRQAARKYRIQEAAVQMFNTLELIDAERELGNVALPHAVLVALAQTLREARGE